MLKIIKRVMKAVIFIAMVCIVVAGILLVAEFSPKNGEELKMIGKDTKVLKTGDSVSILSYNIGHGVSDKDFDYYFEGGSKIKSKIQNVEKNLENIIKTIEDSSADVILVQDVDYKSDISCSINEYTEIANEYEGISCIALTQDSFIPYPFPNIIGRVKTGIATFSNYAGDSYRISLPQNYKFMDRIFNPKKCLLKYVIPIEDSDKALIVFNVDLEDYDDGAMRKSQLESLISEMELEYNKGNYVIAGGDFNMLLKSKGDTNELIDSYSFIDFNLDVLPKDWKVLYDDKVDTFRLRNSVYNKDTSIKGIIDGYIVPPNVSVKSIKAIDNKFEFTNHNPIKLEIKV